MITWLHFSAISLGFLAPHSFCVLSSYLACMWLALFVVLWEEEEVA